MMRLVFLRFLFLALMFLTSSAAQAKEELRIGLIDTFDPDFYLLTFVPTIEHLKKELPSYDLKIVEISPTNIIPDIEKTQPQFVIASAGDFSTLLTVKGAQQIATVKRPQAINSEKAVFATFVVKSKRSDIAKIEDLKNKKVVATSATDFEGWLVPLGEIASKGHDPDNFFKEIQFTEHLYPDVLTNLKVDNADVGIFGPCQYEKLLQSGQITKDEFRVINKKGADEVCLRSTEMYPDVVFFSMDGAPQKAVKAITLSLLSLPEEMNNFEWIPTSNFLKVLDLMKSLKIGPYHHLRETTVKAFVEAHKLEIGLFIALLLAILVHIIRVNMLVKKRTDELTASLAEQQLIESKARENREKLEMLEKSRVISQLSSMFAHEVKQPITNIIYYASGLKMLTEQLHIENAQVKTALDKIGEQARRTAEIIEHVRSYAKHRPSKETVFDLSSIIKRAVESTKEHERKTTEITLKSPDSSVFTKGDPFEIELVVLNLIKNALQAVQSVADPKVIVEISELPGKYEVNIIDNGPPLSDEKFKNLGKPIHSDKADGLGIGLSIAASIVESHGGHLSFKRNQPNGLIVQFCVDKKIGGEKKNDQT